MIKASQIDKTQKCPCKICSMHDVLVRKRKMKKASRYEQARMVNQRSTTHVRLDQGLHDLLVQEAMKRGVRLQEFIEGILIEGLGTGYQKK